jgi:hypothetical protein
MKGGQRRTSAEAWCQLQAANFHASGCRIRRSRDVLGVAALRESVPQQRVRGSNPSESRR